MAATTDITACESYRAGAGGRRHAADQPHLRRQPLFQAASGFVGAALVMTAVALWALPSATGHAEPVLMKLGLTLFLTLGGALFLGAARNREAPDGE